MDKSMSDGEYPSRSTEVSKDAGLKTRLLCMHNRVDCLLTNRLKSNGTNLFVCLVGSLGRNESLD